MKNATSNIILIILMAILIFTVFIFLYSEKITQIKPDLIQLEPASINFDKPQDIIIDTDGSIDDILAILLAVKCPDAVNILAFTTVSGYIEAKDSARNIQLLYNFLQAETQPVISIGAKETVEGKPINYPSYFGRDGLGDITEIYNPNGKKRYEISTKPFPINEDASQTIIKTLKENTPLSVKIICLGPLTNIANTYKKNPAIFNNVKEIIISAGAILTPGNITETAEFNAFADPLALDIILNSNIPIKLIELSASRLMPIKREYIDIIKQSPTEDNSSIFAIDLLDAYFEVAKNNPGIIEPYFKDMPALVFSFLPEIATFENDYIQVEKKGNLTQGMTVADRRNLLKKIKTNNVEVVKKIKSDFLIKFFIDRITIY